MNTEMMRGTMTPAVRQPVDAPPEVTAKMNKIRAAKLEHDFNMTLLKLDNVGKVKSLPVRIDTPPKSRLIHLGLPDIPGVAGIKPPGMRIAPASEMSSPAIATNQKIQGQVAYSTKMAPTIKPRTRVREYR